MKHIYIDDEILLRPFRVWDAEVLFEIVDRDREYLAEFLPWVQQVRTVKDEAGFVETRTRETTTRGLAVGSFIIEYRADIAGAIEVRISDDATRTGEIGYWLAAKMQGRGIMTRACEAVTRHGFDEMDLRRIEIYADRMNSRSRAVPLRLGCADEGIKPHYMAITDSTVDMCAYSMTADEWRERIQS